MTRKFISFEEVESLASIEQLAEMLGLNAKRSGHQLRCACPVHGGDDRTLAISPQVRSKRGSIGVFFCQKAKEGGDRIGLVAHCMEIGQQDAAFFIADQFGTGTVNSDSTVSKERATVPTKPEGGKTAPFDPDAFAKKLTYSDDLATLGVSEEDASRIGLGYHPQRKMHYIAARNPDGSYSGFIGFDLKGAKMPPKWLAPSNVVKLRRA